MDVTREDLEGWLGQVGSDRPKSHGLFGPGSAMWEVSRESVLFLGGGRAALLQIAHPFVAQGVTHHSRTKTDLPGRFQRTFLNVFSLVFGDLDEAVTSARRVHNVHRKVRGTMDADVGPFEAGSAYSANTEAALMWVHATLLDTSVQVYELTIGTLTDARREAFYQDTKRFARLFGITDRVLPPNWAAFRAYMDAMFASDTLTVGDAAQELCGFLLTPPRRRVIPMWRWYQVMTAGLLPARLREDFGLRWGRRERALFASSTAAVRAGLRGMPDRVRYLPAYVDAVRRIDGKGADWFGKLAERVVLGALKQRAVGAA